MGKLSTRVRTPDEAAVTCKEATLHRRIFAQKYSGETEHHTFWDAEENADLSGTGSGHSSFSAQ